MRARFSPPAMLKADASVNQDFFKPRQVAFVTWTSTSLPIPPPPSPSLFLTAIDHHGRTMDATPLQVLLVDNRKWGAKEDDLLYEVRRALVRGSSGHVAPLCFLACTAWRTARGPAQAALSGSHEATLIIVPEASETCAP